MQDDIARANRGRGRGNDDDGESDRDNEIVAKKDSVLEQLKSLLKEKEIDDDLDKVDKLNELVKLFTDDKIKNVSGKIETINLTLTVVNTGVDPLSKIVKTGVKKPFLKIIIGEKYREFASDISEIEDPLFEYTVSEVSISESNCTFVSYLYVKDPENFIVRSVGISLVDQVALEKKEYKEILLALHTQEQALKLNDAKQVNLILNVNLK